MTGPVRDIDQHPSGAWRRCDLHVHTRFSAWNHLRPIRARDSRTEPVAAAARAVAAGMDFVAITDHDSIEGALRLRDAHPAIAPILIIGEEVETVLPDTGQWLHLGVFGLDETTHAEIRRLRGDVRDLVGYLRGRGLLFVLNHPFQSFRFQKSPRGYAEQVLDLFGHIEAGNGMMSAAHHRAVQALLRFAAATGRRAVPVAGSDAHVPDHVGSSWTEAPGASPREWLASVAAGRCRIVARPLGIGALLGQVYGAVGGYYRDLATPEVRAGMTTAGWLAAAALLPGAALGIPGALTLLDAARQRVFSHVVRRRLDRATGARAAAAFAGGMVVEGAVTAPGAAFSTGTGAAPPAATS